MSVFDQIGALTPSNKTAAMVTSRSKDSAVADDWRSEKHRNLVRLSQQCVRAIAATTDPEKKKRLGLQQQRIQAAIIQERGSQVRRVGVPQHFMNVAREMLPRPQFQMILREANQRADEASHG